MDGRFFINGFLLLILNPSGVLNNAVELLKRIGYTFILWVFRLYWAKANAIPRKKRAYAIRPYGAGVIRWVHEGRMQYARTALALFGGSMEGVCNTPVRRWHYSVGPWRAYAIRPYGAGVIRWVHGGRMRYARTALALFGGSMEGVCTTPLRC